MQIISIPTTLLLCGERKCGLYYVKSTTNGVKTVKCINPDCKNLGKICEVHPQIIEVEECVLQEAGKV